jgi:DNA-binding transcriptional MocR family regulator
MDYLRYIREIRSSSLSYKAKLVAIMIASHYDFKTAVPAFPSVDTLARETGLSNRSVSRAKIELVENGWLVTHRQFNRASLSVPTCPTGELNTHINTHINIKKKDSNESFASINKLQQENVEPIFEVIKEQGSAAVQEEWLSW